MSAPQSSSNPIAASCPHRVATCSGVRLSEFLASMTALRSSSSPIAASRPYEAANYMQRRPSVGALGFDVGPAVEQ